MRRKRRISAKGLAAMKANGRKQGKKYKKQYVKLLEKNYVKMGKVLKAHGSRVVK